MTRSDTVAEAADLMGQATERLRDLGDERRTALRFLRRVVKRHRYAKGATMEDLVGHIEDFLADRDDAIAEEEGEG